MKFWRDHRTIAHRAAVRAARSAMRWDRDPCAAAAGGRDTMCGTAHPADTNHVTMELLLLLITSVVAAGGTSRGSGDGTSGDGCGECLPAAATGTPNVLLIGDSISMGSFGYAWPVRWMLANNDSGLATVVHAGGYGSGGQWASSSKMRGCLQAGYLDNHSFDVVTINAGIHDCAEYFSRINETQYAGNLREIFRLLRQHASRVVFVTTTPVPELAVEPPSALHPGCIARRNVLAKGVLAEPEFSRLVSLCDLHDAVTHFCGSNYSDPSTGLGHCAVQRSDGVHFFTKWPFPSGQQFTALKVVRAILPHLPKAKIKCPWRNCTWREDRHSRTVIQRQPEIAEDALGAGAPPPPWTGPCRHYKTCGPPPGPLNRTVPNVLIIGDSISDSGSGYGPLVRSLIERPGRYQLCADPTIRRNASSAGQCLNDVNYPPGALAAVHHNGGWYDERNGSHNTGAFEQSGDACHLRKCLGTYLGTGGWDVIAFNAGIHGCLTGDQFVTDADYRKDIIAIYEQIIQALAPGGTVIWTTTTPVATDWPGVAHHIDPGCIPRRNAIVMSALGGKPRLVVNDLYGAVTAVCGAAFKLGDCPIQNGAPASSTSVATGGMHFNAAGRQFTALVTAQTIVSQLGPGWRRVNCSWEGATSNSTARCTGWPT
jgi:lysophospholipase L1-like esterase